MVKPNGKNFIFMVIQNMCLTTIGNKNFEKLISCEVYLFVIYIFNSSIVDIWVNTGCEFWIGSVKERTYFI